MRIIPMAGKFHYPGVRDDFTVENFSRGSDFFTVLNCFHSAVFEGMCQRYRRCVFFLFRSFAPSDTDYLLGYMENSVQNAALTRR